MIDVCIIENGIIINIVTAETLKDVTPLKGQIAVAWMDDAYIGGAYDGATKMFIAALVPPPPEPRPPALASVVCELLKDKGIVTQAEIDTKTTALTV